MKHHFGQGSGVEYQSPLGRSFAWKPLGLPSERNNTAIHKQIGIHTKSEIIPNSVFPKIKNKSCFNNVNNDSF